MKETEVLARLNVCAAGACETGAGTRSIVHKEILLQVSLESERWNWYGWYLLRPKKGKSSEAKGCGVGERNQFKGKTLFGGRRRWAV